MRNRSITRSNESGAVIFLILLMTVFSLLRIYRNSILFNSGEQGGIWNIIAGVFVIIGIFAILKKRMISKNVFFVLLLYSMLIWVHEFIHFSGFTVNNIYYFITAPYFVFVMFAFYYFHGESKHAVIWIIRISYIAVFSMLVYSFIRFRRGTLEDLLLADVYYPLCLLPILFLFEKKGIVKILATIGTGILIIISEKRAALIGFTVFVLCQYVFSDKNVTRRDKIKKASAIILILATSFYGYLILLNTIGSRLIFRMSMLVDTGGAGRSRIYSAIIKAFFQSSIIEQLIGHGRGSIALIPNVNHTSAHSDFLHILYVYGLLPFVLFLMFYVQLFLEWVKMKKSHYPYSSLFFGGYCICLLLSMFSTFCVSFGYVTCGAAFMGLILSDWRKYQLMEDASK